MEDYVCYEDIPESPGLTALQPSLGSSSSQPLPFGPLWLPQDLENSPLVSLNLRHNFQVSPQKDPISSQGLQWTDFTAWMKKFGMFQPLVEDMQFWNALLIHQMDPSRRDNSIALAEHLAGSDTDSDIDEQDSNGSAERRRRSRRVSCSY